LVSRQGSERSFAQVSCTVRWQEACGTRGGGGELALGGTIVGKRMAVRDCAVTPGLPRTTPSCDLFAGASSERGWVREKEARSGVPRPVVIGGERGHTQIPVAQHVRIVFASLPAEVAGSRPAPDAPRAPAGPHIA